MEDLTILDPETLLEAALKQMGFDSAAKFDTEATPLRWLRAIEEFCQGPPDVEAIMKDGFTPASSPGMVIETDIPFRMLCEHHLFPAMGKAYIGYIPKDSMTGLSKMARLVDAFGVASPGTQEIITENIGRAIDEHLKPAGVAVVISSAHTCMETRGAHTPGVVTKTSFMHGLFRDSSDARHEFLSLAGIK